MHPLKKWRFNNGDLTQGELAALVGSTTAAISKIENMKRRPPPELADRIVAKTGLSYDALMRPNSPPLLSPPPGGGDDYAATWTEPVAAVFFGASQCPGRGMARMVK